MKTKRITTFTALLISSVAVALTPVSALDITGSYDDKGTVIGSTTGDNETISFHGMLSLDFDPIMAEAKYGDTTHIDLIDKEGKLDIEIIDKEGKMVWGAVWRARDGYSHEGESAVIRISNGTSDGSRTSLVITPLNDGAYLEVTAYKITATAVGPKSDPIGSYIFVKN
ncbi:MAG: hypothetical protein HOH58_00845 [Opitutaceae bacterium]|nr:hypothetical protein [Opitutaceae bacterium]